jgi:hypothetical protein
MAMDRSEQKHAAYGIGFRQDTSPPVGSCTVTLGCRRVTETEKQRLKEKCSGSHLPGAWRGDSERARQEYADEPSSHRAHAEEFYL